MAADADSEAELRSFLEEGADLYNAGEFWEAHEAWEEAWLALREQGREQLAHLVQGLILASAAFENLSRGKPRGFATQGAKALHRLRSDGEQLEELGVREPEAFEEALLELYLDVQRRKLEHIDELDASPPRLHVRPE